MRASSENESTGSQTVIDIDEVDGDVTIGSAERETKGTRQVWNVELRQSIFRWQNWAELSRANVEGAQAEAEYVVAQQDLIVRTAEAYFNVLAARDTLEAAQAAHDAIGRQLEQSEKRFEVGLIAVTDVQDAKAAFDSATAALIQGKRNLANAGELLRELTGDAWDTLEKPGNDMPLAGPNPASPEDWVKLALDQNARLTASRLAADVTRQVISIERGGHFPEVDFVVSRGEFEDNGRFTNQGGVTFPSDADSEDTTYGVQVTAADLFRRRDVLTRAPGAIPPYGRPGAPRANGSRDRALDAGRLPRCELGSRARAVAEAGRRLRADRAAGD